MNKKNLKIVESFDDIKIYQESIKMNKIGAQAMQEEKEKNKKLGIPSSFIQNGQILYELPDGTITTEQPWGK
ncbi:MAG: hypothetical protein MK033_05980 [Candidatus Caenarcaniphilales bacterium]|nr:hypothetical protein [Candidatus Caenarcaniphilales bacterium]